MRFKKTLWLVVLVVLFLPTHAILGQGDAEWTCDEGPQDILLATQAALDEGDAALAAELIEEAMVVCADDIRRFQAALALQQDVDAAVELAVIASATPGFVDLGDYTLYMTCEGEGSPTIIFENGSGTHLHTWNDVFPDIAAETRACRYDRLGAGFSDPVPPDILRTAQDAADDLHALLEIAEIEGPYVLVGHSIAGINIPVFFSQYGEDVAGIVFVDPAPVNFIERMSEVDPGVEDDMLEPGTGPEHYDYPASVEEAKALESYGDIPLIVLTAEDSPSEVQRPVWLELHAEIAALSTNGQQIVLADTGHFIQNDNPEPVIDAILEVIEAVRANAEE